MKYLGLLTVILLANLTYLRGQQVNLSLEEALSIAMEKNRALKSQRLQLENAKENTRISKADMLPTVNASANYLQYFDRQVIFMPGAFTGNEAQPVVDVAVGGKNAIGSYLTFAQPLVSEMTRRSIKSMRLNEEIESLFLEDFRDELVVSVSIAYYRAQLIDEMLKLNHQSLSRNQKSLNDSKSMYDQGRSLKVDTLRNFIAVENLRATISHLENQHRVALLKLKQLLGSSDSTDFILTDRLTDNIGEANVPNERLHDRSVQSRTDILIKEMQLKLAGSRYSVEKAERLPKLSLVGAYQVQAQADHRNFGEYRWPATSFIGLQANIPLFNGGRINARIRQSRIQREKQEIELLDATENAKTELILLEGNLEELVKRQANHAKTVEAAEVNYQIINDRYGHGLSSRLELTDAELALTEARLNQLNAVYEVKVAELQLEKASGKLRK